MARENFRREQELLRTLLLDGGAMTRRQLAAQMGLSVESLDKVLAELKEAWDATCGDVPLRCEQGSYILDRSRQSHSSLMCGVLNILYRLKAVRQTEIDRIAFILGRMSQTCQTVPSLIEAMACETELGEPDRSLRDIAHGLGFAELSPFYRAFQRWTGTTPAQWRRQAGAPVPTPDMACGH